MCTVKNVTGFFLFSPFSVPFLTFLDQPFMCFSFNQFFCPGWELHEHTLFVVITIHPVSGIVPSSEKQLIKYLSNEGKKEQCSKVGVSLFLALTLTSPSFLVLQPLLIVHTGNLKSGDLFDLWPSPSAKAPFVITSPFSLPHCFPPFQLSTPCFLGKSPKPLQVSNTEMCLALAGYVSL